MTSLGRPVRIVADDLTGALDAAAPFARPDRPVGLVLHPTEVPDRAALTISSESRDCTPADAAAATIRACNVLRKSDTGDHAIWFHKVDSVLRGHPFVTTAAMMRHLGKARCVFAPAFPAMGRITRGGQHLVRQDDGWFPAPQADIAAGLAVAGLIPARAAVAGVQGANALMVDAVTQDDLDQAVARQTDPDLLWVGSRGLAEALAGPVVAVPSPPIGIVVIGTTHPVTRAQVAFAGGHLMPMAAQGPIRPEAGKCVIIDAAAQSANAAMTSAAVQRAVERIDPRGLVQRSLFVTGGETLSVVLKSAGARHLDCLGEVGPGLPISVVRGGSLDGCSIISKSGGFGAPDLIARLC